LKSENLFVSSLETSTFNNLNSILVVLSKTKILSKGFKKSALDNIVFNFAVIFQLELIKYFLESELNSILFKYCSVQSLIQFLLLSLSHFLIASFNAFMSDFLQILFFSTNLSQIIDLVASSKIHTQLSQDFQQVHLEIFILGGNMSFIQQEIAEGHLYNGTHSGGEHLSKSHSSFTKFHIFEKDNCSFKILFFLIILLKVGFSDFNFGSNFINISLEFQYSQR
jgi:hypothetical protein